MRTIDHKFLGIQLAETYLSRIPQKMRQSFLMGNIEPDYNPLTYLRGSLKAHLFHGHHFENAKTYIDTLILHLSGAGFHERKDYFRLGRLMHYLADAFTFAHNETFPGTLREHTEYEEELHQYFISKDRLLSPSADFLLTKNTGDWHRLHEIYQGERADVRNDAAYIPMITGSVMVSLLCR